MQWRRRIVLALVAVVIIGGLAYGFRPQPVLVEMAPVTRAPLRVTVEQEGKTRVVDRYVISAPVAGYAQRIGFDVGDTVRAGQPLVRLEPRRAEGLDPRQRAQAEARVAGAAAAIEAAQERLRAAQAEAALARADLERSQRLRAAQHSTVAEEERAVAAARRTEAEQRSAQFGVDVARHEWAAARTALQYVGAPSAGKLDGEVVVRAPVAGRVLKIQHQSEGVVDSGQALIEIGDPRTLEVEVDVLSADAVRIRPGTRVVLERWGGEQPLEGVVRVVEPAGFTKVSALGVEEQRVWVIASLVSPPARWEHLGDGYRVEASFILWEGQDVLQVPASALFRQGAGWAAFVVRDGKARVQVVELGQRNGLSAQVVSGLAEGVAVLVHPDDKVQDGVRVQAR